MLSVHNPLANVIHSDGCALNKLPTMNLLVRPFLFFSLLLSSSLCRGQAPGETPAPAPKEPNLQWHDVTQWGVEGRAFADLERKRWFDRFPAAAEGQVTDAVWKLSRESAGMMVRFKTNASAVWVNYALLDDTLAGVNMTKIGSSGIDLYARDAVGTWRWVAVAKPNTQLVRQEIVSGLAPGTREYAAYLPLRNGIERLSIGVATEATFEPLTPRSEKPIVFYGTSITHGASASRPGMTHVAIIGRRMDRPVINLGFSGNGRMDAAVGDLLVKIEAAVYVIDCLPNMNAALVRERCIPLVKQLRSARPDTPIVLVEDRRYASAWILSVRNRGHTENHAALKECFETLKTSGVTGLFYLPGDALLGDDNEATTDGSHPNDLGFVRQADQFEPVLRAALGLK